MGEGARTAAGVAILTLLGTALGYAAATAYLTWAQLGLGAPVDLARLARQLPTLAEARPEQHRVALVLLGLGAVGGLMVGALVSGTALTRFGVTRWQTRRDLARGGFLGDPGRGFVLGKLGSPASNAPYLTSEAYPHALVVAPTGRGKTSGFVIPNLLAFQGSVVVLDVKGECFEQTARHRAARGDAVFRFAPDDWLNPTHRFNPIARIARLPSAAQQQQGLKLLADQFLTQPREEGLLSGGVQIFVAAGMLAIERDRPTMGEIYRIAMAGGDKQAAYAAAAREVGNAVIRREFEGLASINDKTLTSYVSVLATAGLNQWSNPAIDYVTGHDDFDFLGIRRRPMSVYFVIPPLMLEPLAPLVRLFFADLLVSLQGHAPDTDDEPWPVMIMLDEFNRLGRLPIVVNSIETLRSYRAHLAVITQTIPALDELYGENTRKSFQGNAGVKLYLTPSDEKTIDDVVRSVGKTTKRVVSRSRSLGGNPFQGRSLSERTEERDLLPPDEARRLDPDDIVVVVDGRMPIRAKRIKHYEDRHLRPLVEAQTGKPPMPARTRADQDAAIAALVRPPRLPEDPADGRPEPLHVPGRRRAAAATASAALREEGNAPEPGAAGAAGRLGTRIKHRFAADEASAGDVEALAVGIHAIARDHEAGQGGAPVHGEARSAVEEGAA